MDWTYFQQLFLSNIRSLPGSRLSDVRGNSQFKSKLVILTVISCGLAIGISLTCLLSLLVDAVTGWLRPMTAFYVLALLSPRHQLGNGNLFIIIFTIDVIEFMTQIICPVIAGRSFVMVTLFFILTFAVVLMFASHICGCLNHESAVQLLIFSSLVHILTPGSESPSWTRFWLFAATGFTGTITARCTESLIRSQVVTGSNSLESKSFVWKRRHSSPRKMMQRRTSFPNLEAGRSLSLQGNNVRILLLLCDY
jgi:hypothetical protein